MGFIKKHKDEIIAGGIILAAIGGYTFYRKNKKKASVIKEIKQYSNSTVGTINLRETARQLGIDLGTEYSWYNPKSWTENDDKALATMMAIPKSLIPSLAMEYANIYGRSLQKDLQEHLDEYDKIRHLFL